MTQTLDEIYTTPDLGDESVVIEFDFRGELSAPSAAMVSVTPVNGADPGAAAMLDGSVQIVGASVFQRVKPGIAGLNYRLRCRAVDGNEVRVRSAILPVREA